MEQTHNQQARLSHTPSSSSSSRWLWRCTHTVPDLEHGGTRFISQSVGVCLGLRLGVHPHHVLGARRAHEAAHFVAPTVLGDGDVDGVLEPLRPGGRLLVPSGFDLGAIFDLGDWVGGRE